MGRYDVMTHVDSRFLQMFIWVWFFMVASKPVEYLAVTMEKVTVTDR